MRSRNYLIFFISIIILTGCTNLQASPTAYPTLEPLLNVGTPEQAPARTSQSQATPFTTAQAAINEVQELTTEDQYRIWMEEARDMYPYAESTDTMWNVMICESSGRADIKGAGGLVGLFQYLPATWNGDWNPYRDTAITDAKSQIFATAKAWSDGYQHWWAPCL